MTGQILHLDVHQVTQVMLKVGDFMLNTWDLKWECLKIPIKKLDFTHGIYYEQPDWLLILEYMHLDGVEIEPLIIYLTILDYPRQILNLK